MANLVKHRFVSAKTDGADASQVQPSNWNDGHVFAGGNAGDLLTRDPTDATYGAKWEPPAVVGVWANYTPTFTSSGSQPSGASLQGSYVLIGKTCHFKIKLTITAGTVQGSGIWWFGLPVDSVQSGIQGFAVIVDAGTMIYTYPVMYADINRVYIYANVPPFQVGPGCPIAFVAGDEIQILGTFQAL